MTATSEKRTLATSPEPISYPAGQASGVDDCPSVGPQGITFDVGTTLVFASEVKALHAHPGVALKLNETALVQRLQRPQQHAHRMLIEVDAPGPGGTQFIPRESILLSPERNCDHSPAFFCLEFAKARKSRQQCRCISRVTGPLTRGGAHENTSGNSLRSYRFYCVR